MRSTKSLAAAFVGAFMTTGLALPPADAQDPGDLNDLEIAHVAYTAGLVDIRYAHLALAVSESPVVREFAELMLRDHTAVNEQALALVEQLGITPQHNGVSQDLIDQSGALVDEMRVLDPAAFDQRYAENELAYHQFVNGAVRDIFIPNAQTPELRELLESALVVFEVHEQHAEDMVAAVQ